MKLLLTSGGVTNSSIRSVLVELLGKPIAESNALCVPTAQWAHPMCGPTSVRGFLAAEPEWRHTTGLGWASLGVLELTALPTIGADRWVPWIRKADVLLVDGGDATYLCHWMRESGLADLLPSLSDKVWVGVSAGSMVMTPRVGAEFVEWPSAPDDRTLGVVDFLDLPAPGRVSPEHACIRRAVGRRHRCSGIRHRRTDGHQGRQRLRRGGIGRAMDEVAISAGIQPRRERTWARRFRFAHRPAMANTVNRRPATSSFRTGRPGHGMPRIVTAHRGTTTGTRPASERSAHMAERRTHMLRSTQCDMTAAWSPRHGSCA